MAARVSASSGVAVRILISSLAVVCIAAIPLSVIIHNFCKIVTQIVLPRKYPSQSFFRWNLYFFYDFSKGILLDRVFRFRYNDYRFVLWGQNILKNVQKYMLRAEINTERKQCQEKRNPMTEPYSVRLR